VRPKPNSISGSRRRVAAGHRYLGLLASLIVFMLAVTGILLNHSERFELTERSVSSDWLLSWYGLSPSPEPMSFRVDGDWLVVLDRQLYFAGRQIASVDAPLVGAVALEPLLLIATPESILLFTHDEAQDAVDRLGPGSLPGHLGRVGVSSSGRLVVEADGKLYQSDEDLLDWDLQDVEASATWSTPAALPREAGEAALALHRGRGLTQFRVISDLHSGRIFGSFGYLLMDGAAAVLLLLTGSGVFNWIRARQANGSALDARVAEQLDEQLDEQSKLDEQSTRSRADAQESPPQLARPSR
jgi:hypothetical protein